jgi:hypothetical protein
MIFIENSPVYSYEEIKIKDANKQFFLLKVVPTNNNLVWYEIALTKRDTQ